MSWFWCPGGAPPAALQLKDAGGRYPWCDEGLSSLSVEPSCHYEKSKEVLAEECVGKDSCNVVAARSVATVVSAVHLPRAGASWDVFRDRGLDCSQSTYSLIDLFEIGGRVLILFTLSLFGAAKDPCPRQSKHLQIAVKC